MNYVLFVPWRRADEKERTAALARTGREYVSFAGDEHHQKNLDWKKLAQDDRMKKKKEFFEVRYTGRASIILLWLKDGQIYIRGHGLPGDACISSGDNSHESARLHATDVARRLIDSGLQTSFAGKIKCYNCHSAEHGLSGSPFAQVFADTMWQAGYKSCTYWGYLGMLTSFYEERQGQANLHKYAGYKEEFETGGWIIDDKRASERRMQIDPRTG